MCNCIEEFEKAIVEKQLFKSLVVVSAKFSKALIFEDSGKILTKPIIQVELEVQGRKHPVKKDVIYNYCPFCGKEFHPSNHAESEAPNA